MTTYNINIKNLNVKFATRFSGIEVIENINVDFAFGQITGIVGESGSGKSVLGMSILKLLPSTATVTGTCMYGGKDLYKLDRKEIKKIKCKDIGLIAQNPIQALNPVLTIGKQLKEPLIKHLKMSGKEAYGICIKHLKEFGFDNANEIMKKYSFQLSGGMNQRIISIMGLICKPNWIIADEPTKGLDSILRKSVYEVLLNIKEHYTKSMIIITHDLYFAKKICDNIVVMHKGEIVEAGKIQDVFNSPKHPYTKGLINATPQNGMIPIPEGINKKEKSGCKFYDRCTSSNIKCVTDRIDMKRLNDGRLVRCKLYD
ncbi:ABC transporter ATP-binding protein [Clostridium sediminicola]|uniref:ABC transporter ATP-binding protein n=1 Tax=Clostridium sediminicola TaxID=3114879 RepID=UPI0031F23875